MACIAEHFPWLICTEAAYDWRGKAFWTQSIIVYHPQPTRAEWHKWLIKNPSRTTSTAFQLQITAWITLNGLTICRPPPHQRHHRRDSGKNIPHLSWTIPFLEQPASLWAYKSKGEAVNANIFPALSPSRVFQFSVGVGTPIKSNNVVQIAASSTSERVKTIEYYPASRAWLIDNGIVVIVQDAL